MAELQFDWVKVVIDGKEFGASVSDCQISLTPGSIQIVKVELRCLSVEMVDRVVTIKTVE